MRILMPIVSMCLCCSMFVGCESSQKSDGSVSSGAMKECPADCSKPCCAKKACPEGCTKPCCADKGSMGAVGEADCSKAKGDCGPCPAMKSEGSMGAVSDTPACSKSAGSCTKGG